MKALRMKLAEQARHIDRALFFGWSIYSYASEERFCIKFPRVSLYFTDIIASWLEGEECWLVRGPKMEAEDREEMEKRQAELVAAAA